MIEIQNYINGQFQAALSSNSLDDFNPSTGEVYAQIPDSDHTDVQKAYQAAQNAFQAWSQLNVHTRSNYLARIADEIENQLDTLAKAESMDNGKPLSLAKSVDIPRAASNFRFFAQAITQFASESHEDISKKSINFTLRRPLGVVGCISPWNLPLYLFTWKIAPALAMGNTVVAKPSEITPMTAYLLAEICQKVGLPPGVLNIVHGIGHKVGQSIVEHPKIKAISFTGGTTTGVQIAKTAAPMFKKLSLELGGKNPNIIFEDCNYVKMLETTLRSSFANQGQICLCGSRILVHKPLYEKFKKDLVERTSQLKVGNPMDSENQLGAVVSKEHQEKILHHIAQAKEEGNKVLIGGEKLHISGLEKGYFIAPCIIETTTPDCSINQEEVFGPVVSLQTFETEQQALEIANGVRYGLSATVWTENLNRALRISSGLESGIVWVNTWMNRDLRTPFGGMKDSGVGREGGWDALRFFSEPKNVCIEYES